MEISEGVKWCNLLFGSSNDMQSKRTKERSRLRREYIQANYLTASDAYMANELDAPVNTIKVMRQRMGLKRSVENVNGLTRVSERRRGVAGATNAYGEMIPRDY